MRTEQSLRAYIDTVYALRALRVLLMPHAAPETIHTLSKAVGLHRFAPGSEIFKEGDPIERFYLVRSGSVALSRRNGNQDTVVGYCAANSFLDALGCLSAETTRSLNAKAMVATEALSIDYASFKALLKADARLAAKMEAERTEQLTQYAHMQARPKAGSVFDYLMSHGLGEATSVLVIDETSVRGLRSMREGLRGHSRGRLATRPQRRPFVALTAPAHLLPALRASALHAGLPALCDPSASQR